MRFAYVATNQGGEVFRGDIDALTLREAIRAIKEKGLLVTEVQPVTRGPSLLGRIEARLNRVTLLQKALLARHLALMLRAGVTVDHAFELLANQATNRGLRTVLQGVLEAIRRGEALAAALNRYPQVFPQRFVAMVQWGEAGGTLPESLEHLAVQFEHDRELQAKVRGAMVYPLIIVGAIVIVGILMSFFVLPQLVDMIESFDVELPFTTRIFIALTKFIVDYGVIAFPVGILAFILFLAVIHTKAVQPVMHRLYLHIPIVGKIVRMVNLARMNRSFGSLIQSGIPMVDALGITANVLGNVQYQNAIRDVITDTKKGVYLGKALKRYSTIFPPMEIDMITVGEETGKLSDVLLYLANFFEDNVNQLTKNLAQTVEPLLLIIVGIVVAGIVFAVIMPIYQLADVIV